MRWDYPPLDINPVFPGVEDIIIIVIIIIITIIIINIIIIIIIIIIILPTDWPKIILPNTLTIKIKLPLP